MQSLCSVYKYHSTLANPTVLGTAHHKLKWTDERGSTQWTLSQDERDVAPACMPLDVFSSWSLCDLANRIKGRQLNVTSPAFPPNPVRKLTEPILDGVLRLLIDLTLIWINVLCPPPSLPAVKGAGNRRSSHLTNQGEWGVVGKPT